MDATVEFQSATSNMPARAVANSPSDSPAESKPSYLRDGHPPESLFCLRLSGFLPHLNEDRRGGKPICDSVFTLITGHAGISHVRRSFV